MMEIEYKFNPDGSFCIYFYEDEFNIGYCCSKENFKIHQWYQEDHNKIKECLESINIVCE